MSVSMHRVTHATASSAICGGFELRHKDSEMISE